MARRADKRVRRSRRRVLVFAADVVGEAAIIGASGESGVVVEALLIGPAVIVDERLAEVVVVERLAGDSRKASIDSIDTD